MHTLSQLQCKGNARNGHPLLCFYLPRRMSTNNFTWFRLLLYQQLPKGESKNEHFYPSKATTKLPPAHFAQWIQVIFWKEGHLLKMGSMCCVNAFAAEGWFIQRHKEREVSQLLEMYFRVFTQNRRSTDFTDTYSYRHVRTEGKEALWQAMSSWDLNVFLWWMLFCGFLTTILLFPSFFPHTFFCLAFLLTHTTCSSMLILLSAPFGSNEKKGLILGLLFLIC